MYIILINFYDEDDALYEYFLIELYDFFFYVIQYEFLFFGLEFYFHEAEVWEGEEFIDYLFLVISDQLPGFVYFLFLF